MQIKDVVVYSRRGERHVIPFRLGAVNIISGDSKTGKSALIDVIDYCLGSDECDVAHGIIRDTVSWFGLRLQFPGGQAFIARENPPVNVNTSSRAFIREGKTVEIPELPPKDATIQIGDLVATLSAKMGISPNLHTPPEGQTRQPLTTNIRHALFFCYQTQNEISAKNLLFHRQDFFTGMAMKDSIPYLFGAVREDDLALRQQLDLARRAVRQLERDIRERERVVGEGLSRGLGLLSEARQCGLIQDGEAPQTLEDLIRELQAASRKELPQPASPGYTRVTELQRQSSDIQAKISEVSEKIGAAKTYAREAQGFSDEVEQQQVRLESAGLFAEPENHEACPLCATKLEVKVPGAVEMAGALQRLKSNLEGVQRERPKLREYINGLEKEKEELREKLRQKEAEVKGALRQHSEAQNAVTLHVKRAQVVGRISFWLENASEGVRRPADDLKKRLDAALAKVRALEKQLDPADAQERMASVLTKLGVQMSDWSRNLKLEHSGAPIRLDLKKLTVVVERDYPIPLSKLGSGENWVGYHLVSHLALHKFFVQAKRPVPRFLVLDQPSQVYFPPDPKSGRAKKSVDWEAVRRMYHLMIDVASQLAPNFQVIVTDHADLNDKAFAEAVVARWGSGPDDEALVPHSWALK